MGKAYFEKRNRRRSRNAERSAMNIYI